jgi:hypothetical protein
MVCLVTRCVSGRRDRRYYGNVSTSQTLYISREQRRLCSGSAQVCSGLLTPAYLACLLEIINFYREARKEPRSPS